MVETVLKDIRYLQYLSLGHLNPNKCPFFINWSVLIFSDEWRFVQKFNRLSILGNENCFTDERLASYEGYKVMPR